MKKHLNRSFYKEKSLVNQTVRYGTVFSRSVTGALGSIWSTGVEEEKEEIRRDPESKLDISHSLKVKKTGHICYYCSREISVVVLWIWIRNFLADPESDPE